MKKIKNNKNNLINKIIYICFLFFITTFFLGGISDFDFSNIIEKKLAVNSTSDKNMQPDIRILEIEPGDSFKLTLNLNKKAVSGVETIEDFKGYKIEITHMTMAEFIGKIEQINGKYDVIVIGRYIDTGLTGPNGNIDYSNIKYDKISIKSDLRNKSWFNDYSYLENDITNKKAKEIREFIQSGQLIYIDKTIGDNSNNNPDNNNINWTKLYYHLTNSQGDFLRENTENLSNFIRDKKITELNIDNIVNKYIEQANKNLTKQAIYVTSPEGDALGSLGDIKKRNMTFNITSKKPKNEELTINLYLDINGDGLFKEDEKVKTVSGVNLSNGDYELQYNIYEDYPQFIGYLDWKIEAIKSNNGYSIPIKSHYDGSITFTRLEGEDKRTLNVLQVLPISSDNPTFDASKSEGGKISNTWYNGNLNLNKNILFQDLLKKDAVSDYDVNIDVISYQDFYNGKYLGPGRESLNKSKYDMIIMGFSDMYPEEFVSREAVDQLKEYVKAGKSLMLTHDTLTYWKAWDGLENASELMKAFRDVSGQSRYIDKLNLGETDFNGNKILHDVNKPTDNTKKENGSTFVGMYSGLNADTTESNKVYKTNKTVLTSYPFEIADDEIPVRETHGQYFQLNLEDEDTVPILNLTEQNDVNSGNYKNQISFNNKYDSRNFYYTYSRGNITFSGTGENGRQQSEYPLSEMKLFINTIVKAERSANHKPIISGLNEEDAAEVSPNNDFNFDIVVKDPDRDNVKINSIIVEGQDISSINNLSTEYAPSGTTYSLKISKDILSKYINKEITVKIEAEDERKAISIKEYNIKVVSNALIVQKSIKKQLVVNEKESFIIDLETENDSNPTSIIIDTNITNPQIEGIFEIESIKPINENGKLKLEIKNLVAYQKEKGREINIPLSYTTSGNKKNVIIKIIYDSDYIRTELPDITAELTSVKTIEVNDDNSKELTLEYRITPKEFATSDISISNKEIGEVIFILDINQNIPGNQKTNIQNGMNNILINKNEYSNLKFGVLGFCDNPSFGVIENNNNGYSGKILDKIDDTNNRNPFFTNSVAQEMDRYREVVSNIWNTQNTTNNRDISKSLIMAKELFDKFGNENVGKAIVLILGDSINNDSQELLDAVDKIKSSGYKIITLDISGGRSSNELKKFHQSLGGNIESNNYEGDYFKPSLTDSNYNEASKDVQKIADRLKGNSGNNSYKITPTFTFDLNDNFEYYGSYNGNIELNSINGNVVKFTLSNPIEYTYSNRQNQHGEYIFNSTKEYIDIKFTVKVKDNKIGTLTFGENINILDTSTYKNYFEYNNIKGTVNKRALETPTVIVKEQIKNITHGLYNGISNGQLSIQENNNGKAFEIAQGSTVTFGANFTFSGSSTEFNLNVDDKFSSINPNDIKTYKVLKDSLGNSTLKELDATNKSIVAIVDNKFKVSINNMTDSSSEILVVYQGKIIDGTESGQALTNNIVFSSTSTSVTIVTPPQLNNSPILPDLF